MRKTITSIVSIGIFAFTLSFASCDFMAGMAAGAAYGLANTAYYYPSYSYTPYYNGNTSSSSSSSTSANVKKTLETESDGFQWYKLNQDYTYYGAESTNGTTLIPLSRKYTFICYLTTDGGWFNVEKNDKEGACDKSGREIVAPKYDNVYYRNSDGFEYYYVECNGKNGACDKNGREIIAPRYNSVLYTSGHFSCDDGYYTKEGKPENAISSSSSTTSSTSSSTTSSSGTYMPQGGYYGNINSGIYNGGNMGSGSNSNQSSTSVNPVQPHQITESCPICHGSGKCNTCNGRHWYYGYSGNQITCPNCRDGRCTHCGGSGQVTKTVYY